MILTRRQAKEFIFLKHSLIGGHRFIGKQGVLEYFDEFKCIQYDPIDVCGKNAELVLQAKVKGFKKEMLYDLLYKERELLDYPDKQLCIIKTQDLPYFARYKEIAVKNGKKYPEILKLVDEFKEYIDKNGVVGSDDIKITDNFYWHSAIHWSGGNNMARSVLEHMYATCELVIHHKKGTRKYYDLATNHLSKLLLEAPDPFPNEFEHKKWRVLRRIEAVGLLWNRPSDAWLNIIGMSSSDRNRIFKELLEENKIIEITITNFKYPVYCKSEDIQFLNQILGGEKLKKRLEFIAPLDSLIWDRKLIKELFDFDYKWEIYTKKEKRKYGFYVLPIIYGENFMGRIEVVVDRTTSTLEVKNIWLEDSIKSSQIFYKKLDSTMKRFARFNKCMHIQYMN